jgi:hypothetical protein
MALNEKQKKIDNIAKRFKTSITKDVPMLVPMSVHHQVNQPLIKVLAFEPGIQEITGRSLLKRELKIRPQSPHDCLLNKK